MIDVQAVAGSFVGARRNAIALADFPGPLPKTLGSAYEIQDAAIALRAHAVGGWKVGRIQPPLDTEFGATRIAGPIFSDQIFKTPPIRDMPVFAGGFGAVEAEFLFRLGEIPAGRTNWSIEDALDCVEAVHVGFEIASSPFGGINRFGPAVTVSDFGNNNGIVVGPALVDWKIDAIDALSVTMHIDGKAVGTGRATSFPDGCGGSVAFLLNQLASRGITPIAGCWVSTGAVTGVHEIAPGSTATADFGGLQHITCRIVAAG